MRKKFFNKICKMFFLGLILVFVASQISILPARASILTSLSDTMSQLKASTAANHLIKFVTPSGVDAGETITVAFVSGFNLGSVDYTDIDLAEGNSDNCSTATFVDKDLAATPSGATWGAAISGQVITFTSGAGTITADRCVSIEIGTNATYGVTGDAQITNPTAGNNKQISIAGTFGDSGLLGISIVGDDQISIAATVEPIFTFTISADTCALGDMVITSVSTCSYTLAVGTNASSGAKITIQAISDGTNSFFNKNSDATYDVDNVTEGDVVTAGTEGYGVAVTAGAGWTEEGDFNDDDTPIPSVVTDILSTSGPIQSSATSTITHRAAAATVTASGAYSQTVQYVATGTF